MEPTLGAQKRSVWLCQSLLRLATHACTFQVVLSLPVWGGAIGQSYPRRSEFLDTSQLFALWLLQGLLVSRERPSTTALPIFPLCCPPHLWSLNPWATVGWNGPQFTRLPKVPPLLGSFSGSVVPVVRPRPFRTFLPCPQSRVLSVPPLLGSCLVGPLDAWRVSAFPVNTQCPTTATVPPLTPVPPVVPLPSPNDDPVDRFSHALCQGSRHSMGGSVATPLSPGSGTQSWLFCPPISLGLAVAESRMGVPSLPRTKARVAWKVVLYFENRASICSHALILLSPTRGIVTTARRTSISLQPFVQLQPFDQTCVDCGPCCLQAPSQGQC